MQTYRVTYLLPRIETAGAVAEPGLPGQYRHQNLVAARREADVIAEVRDRGGVPLGITLVKPRRMQLWRRDQASQRERLLQSMVLSVQSGISATRALQRALEGGAVPDEEVADAALTVLRAGGGFGDGIRALGMFDESTVAILESGERTGRMADSLQAALEHFQKRANGTKAMVGAVSWTVFDLVFAAVSIISLRFGMLPSVAESGIKGSDPLAKEKFLRALDWAFIVNDALMILSILLLLATGLLAWGHFSHNEALHRRADRILRKVPSLGAALEHNAISASFTVAAAMLKGGVGFPHAAEVATRATRLEPVQRIWRQAHTRVSNGLSVVMALRTPMLSTSETLLVAAHTTQKQLSRVLGDIATQRDAFSMSASKRFAVFMFIGSLAYSGAAVLLTLWVVYLQNQQMMTNMQAAG